MSHAPRQAASEHRGAGLPAPGRVLADVIEYTSDGIRYLAPRSCCSSRRSTRRVARTRWISRGRSRSLRPSAIREALHRREIMNERWPSHLRERGDSRSVPPPCRRHSTHRPTAGACRDQARLGEPRIDPEPHAASLCHRLERGQLGRGQLRTLSTRQRPGHPAGPRGAYFVV